MALEDGSRYCYSPAAASDSPRELLPNSPNSFSRHSSTASSPTTICDVEHKHEVITEDEEAEDINVDDDDPFDKAFNAKTENLSKFSFSINNILSDAFGPKPVKLEPNQNTDKNIFRPFEIKNFINTTSNNKPFVQNPSSIFLSNFRLSELIDFSTKNASPQNKSDSSLRNSLYNSLASYPKIQEEIRNSHKKYPNNSQQTSNFHSSSSKIPPLGGLCKTISQIGQERVTQPSFTTLAPCLSAKSKSNSLESINKIQHSSTDSTVDSDDCTSEASTSKDESQKMWPAWIFCTRYSDRPSSGPRYRRPKEKKEKGDDEKRPRTAFSNEQLTRLKREFNENRYLTEKRRQQLSGELGLNEAQIKIWFQNKRAKIKKTSGQKNSLALQLMAQGLYNHTTVPLTKEEEELEMRMNGQLQ